MSTVAAAVRALIGLFIDDGSLALGALIWFGLCALLFRETPSGGPAFFVGLAVLLVENTWRAARRKGDRRGSAA